MNTRFCFTLLLVGILLKPFMSNIGMVSFIVGFSPTRFSLFSCYLPLFSKPATLCGLEFVLIDLVGCLVGCLVGYSVIHS